MNALENILKGNISGFKTEIESILSSKMEEFLENKRQEIAATIFEPINENSSFTYKIEYQNSKGERKKLSAATGHNELDGEMSHYLHNFKTSDNQKLHHMIVTRSDNKEVHYSRATDKNGYEYWDNLRGKK